MVENNYIGERGEQEKKARESQKWPEAGDKMRFLNENGYDVQLEQARQHFEVGKEYIVDAIVVSSFDHAIKFKEVPGTWFNGVMFELVEPKP